MSKKEKLYETKDGMICLPLIDCLPVTAINCPHVDEDRGETIIIQSHSKRLPPTIVSRNSYIAKQEWAAKMNRTHIQCRCPQCCLYTVWWPRPKYLANLKKDGATQ